MSQVLGLGGVVLLISGEGFARSDLSLSLSKPFLNLVESTASRAILRGQVRIITLSVVDRSDGLDTVLDRSQGRACLKVRALRLHPRIVRQHSQWLCT